MEILALLRTEGVATKAAGMQPNPQAAGHYGHGQYGNNAPVPQQYGGQGGPSMRGGMRGQQPAPRGGGGQMMGTAHQGYYSQDVNQVSDNSMNYPPTQPPMNPRGGYGGGMGNQRGGMQGSGAQGGQGNQRMYNQMPQGNVPIPHQPPMAPMHQNPSQQRNLGQASNPNMGYNEYIPPKGGRPAPDQGYGSPIPNPAGPHGMPQNPSPPVQNRPMVPPPQARAPPQQNMAPPVQGMMPQNQMGQYQPDL